MALPNRRPVYNGQTPPIFDRSQMRPPLGEHQGGGGQFPPSPPNPYHGYGIANMFQRLGDRYDVGSAVPTGGFGFDQGQKAALAPLLQQIPGLVAQGAHGANQGGDLRGPGPFQMDSSGGILQALQSIGVDTGNMQGLGIGGDQRTQFLHSLQQFLTGMQNRPNDPNNPPNRKPPGYYSPGHQHEGGPQLPPYAYSPGYTNHRF